MQCFIFLQRVQVTISQMLLSGTKGKKCCTYHTRGKVSAARLGTFLYQGPSRLFRYTWWALHRNCNTHTHTHTQTQQQRDSGPVEWVGLHFFCIFSLLTCLWPGRNLASHTPPSHGFSWLSSVRACWACSAWLEDVARRSPPACLDGERLRSLHQASSRTPLCLKINITASAISSGIFSHPCMLWQTITALRCTGNCSWVLDGGRNITYTSLELYFSFSKHCWLELQEEVCLSSDTAYWLYWSTHFLHFCWLGE